ncbi:hypothetical protein JCM4914_25830 [Streptomyces platensis subsp. malvinus]
MWGCIRGGTTTCMLVLAVAAGEPGGNPGLSRNGVRAHPPAFVDGPPCARKSEDLPTARPYRHRCGRRYVRAPRDGPMDAARCARAPRTDGVPHARVRPSRPALPAPAE